MIWQDTTSEHMKEAIVKSFSWSSLPQSVWEGYFRTRTYFLIRYDRDGGIPTLFGAGNPKTLWLLAAEKDGKLYRLGQYGSLHMPRLTPPKTWANRIMNNGKSLKRRE